MKKKKEKKNKIRPNARRNPVSPCNRSKNEIRPSSHSSPSPDRYYALIETKPIDIRENPSLPSLFEYPIRTVDVYAVDLSDPRRAFVDRARKPSVEAGGFKIAGDPVYLAEDCMSWEEGVLRLGFMGWKPAEDVTEDYFGEETTGRIALRRRYVVKAYRIIPDSGQDVAVREEEDPMADDGKTLYYVADNIAQKISDQVTAHYARTGKAGLKLARPAHAV